MEKTVWGCTRITFLGLVIDTLLRMVFIPPEKITKALELINQILSNNKRTVRVSTLQSLSGFLNFLCKCVVPGRAFNRRLYYLTAGTNLQKHHHVHLNKQVKHDLQLWKSFLMHPTAYNREFIEFDSNTTSVELFFYTDASSTRGCGGVFDNEWFIHPWDDEIFESQVFYPSINYLELYALTAGVLLWSSKFKNKFVTVFCDNMSVIFMINNNTSKCPFCMALIRILVLHSMVENVRIKAVYVPTKLNYFADALSRLDYKRFRSLARQHDRRFEQKPKSLPSVLYPMQSLWNI